MQGVCQQKHFPAVAQPFRVLWAPWPLAVAGLVVSIFSAVFLMISGLKSMAAIGLPLMMVGFHGGAVILGLKLRYVYPLLLSIESRKTGSNNLGAKGHFVFGNI